MSCHVPNHRDESPCHDRKRDTADGSAQSRETPRYPKFLLEPISDNARERAEAHPTRQLWDWVSDANARRNGEKCVLRPVCRALGGTANIPCTLRRGTLPRRELRFQGRMELENDLNQRCVPQRLRVGGQERIEEIRSKHYVRWDQYTRGKGR